MARHLTAAEQPRRRSNVRCGRLRGTGQSFELLHSVLEEDSCRRQCHAHSEHSVTHS